MDQSPNKTPTKKLITVGGIALLVIGCVLLAIGLLSRGDAVSEADRPAGAPVIAAPEPVNAEGQELSLTVVDGGSDTGRVITDSRGFVVYGNATETADELACLASCTTSWVPVTPRDAAVGDGLDLTLFGSFERSDDGSLQVTYNGIPLYTWTGDSAIGITSGAGVAGTWFALTETGGFVS